MSKPDEAVGRRVLAELLWLTRNPWSRKPRRSRGRWWWREWNTRASSCGCENWGTARCWMNLMSLGCSKLGNRHPLVGALAYKRGKVRAIGTSRSSHSSKPLHSTTISKFGIFWPSKPKIILLKPVHVIYRNPDYVQDSCWQSEISHIIWIFANHLDRLLDLSKIRLNFNKFSVG